MVASSNITTDVIELIIVILMTIRMLMGMLVIVLISTEYLKKGTTHQFSRWWSGKIAEEYEGSLLTPWPPSSPRLRGIYYVDLNKIKG